MCPLLAAAFAVGLALPLPPAVGQPDTWAHEPQFWTLDRAWAEIVQECRQTVRTESERELIHQFDRWLHAQEQAWREWGWGRPGPRR